MELMGVLIKRLDYTKASPKVHLVMAPDMYSDSKQKDYLRQIREAVEPMDIDFTWEIDDLGIHARHLRVDDRWDILRDRGSTSGRSSIAGTRSRWRARCLRCGG